MLASRWPLIAATILLFTSTLKAPAAEDKACPVVTKATSVGASVAIRPAGKNHSPAESCEVFVYDASGRIVYQGSGYHVEIDPATGRDLDQDGSPDIVILKYSSERKSRFETAIVFFERMRTRLLQTAHGTFDFQTASGHNLLWTPALFEDLGQDPEDPIVVRTIREWTKGGLIDVTTTYCKRMLAGELQGPGNLQPLLNSLLLRSKQASRTNTGSLFDREQAREAAMSLALQQIYCGQTEDASQLVLEVWPADEQTVIRRRLKDAVNGRWPDLAKKLSNW